MSNDTEVLEQPRTEDNNGTGARALRYFGQYANFPERGNKPKPPFKGDPWETALILGTGLTCVTVELTQKVSDKVGPTVAKVYGAGGTILNQNSAALYRLPLNDTLVEATPRAETHEADTRKDDMERLLKTLTILKNKLLSNRRLLQEAGAAQYLTKLLGYVIAETPRIRGDAAKLGVSPDRLVGIVPATEYALIQIEEQIAKENIIENMSAEEIIGLYANAEFSRTSGEFATCLERIFVETGFAVDILDARGLKAKSATDSKGRHVSFEKALGLYTGTKQKLAADETATVLYPKNLAYVRQKQDSGASPASIKIIDTYPLHELSRLNRDLRQNLIDIIKEENYTAIMRSYKNSTALESFALEYLLLLKYLRGSVV